MEYDHSKMLEIEKALIDNPYNIPALCKLGQWLVQEQDIHEACKIYDKIIRLDIQNQRAWIALGHCNLLRQRYELSFFAYQTALSQYPSNAYLWFGIASLYKKFNQIHFSKRAFKKVLATDCFFEFQSEVHYNLGLIYKETAKFEKALYHLKRSMPPLPVKRKVEVLRHIGQCYENCSLYENALSAYQEAVNLEPNNSKTLEHQGWCLFLDEKYDLAIEVFRRGLAFTDNDPAQTGDLHYLIGRSYLELENYSSARIAFENALKNNQNSAIYWWSTAVLYEKRGKRSFAIQFIKKALDLDEYNAELWFLLGVLYEKDLMIVEAAEAYQLAIENEFDPAVEYLNSVGEGTELPEFHHPEIYITRRSFSLEYNYEENDDDDDDDAQSDDLKTEASSNIEEFENRERGNCSFEFTWFLLNIIVQAIMKIGFSKFLPIKRKPTRDLDEKVPKFRKI